MTIDLGLVSHTSRDLPGREGPAAHHWACLQSGEHRSHCGAHTPHTHTHTHTHTRARARAGTHCVWVRARVRARARARVFLCVSSIWRAPVREATSFVAHGLARRACAWSEKIGRGTASKRGCASQRLPHCAADAMHYCTPDANQLQQSKNRKNRPHTAAHRTDRSRSAAVFLSHHFPVPSQDCTNSQDCINSQD